MKKLLTRYFNFIKKFIPSQPGSTSIGLEIATSECRMIEVKKEGKIFRVVRCACERIQGNNSQEAVKNALLDVDIAHASVHTSVLGKGTLIRYIEMPRMSIDELRSSFSLEADKYFPFASDQIYTDCFILDPLGKTKQMEVLAAASTKDLVDARLKLLNDAGLQPEHITINSVALSNIISVLGLNRQHAQEAKIYAIVDIGETVSSVTIMDDITPRFSRDIFIGGKDLLKRIGNTLGVADDEAKELFLNPGDKRNDIAAACDSILQNITQEIRLSFDYFSTEKNKEVSQVILTGEMASGPGILKALGDNLEINVTLWNPFDQCEVGEGVNASDIKTQVNKFNVALGLALLQHD